MDNKKLLADLLAQPGKVRPEHASMLQEMVQQFPYSQPIHLLLAKANASFVPKAALYGQGHVLFHVLNMVPVYDEEELPVSNNGATVAHDADEQEVIEEVIEPAIENPVQLAETDPTVAEDNHDEQEVFEEIGEISPGETSPLKSIAEVEMPDYLPVTDQLMDWPAVDDSFIESVAAVDFFAFEQKMSTDVVTEAPQIETVIPDDPEHSFVSQYNDDKLPYTFLWWLAKTRKEHEQIFQPYAPAKQGPLKPQPQNNQQQDRAEFQQQYVEHIFHIQTPFEVADHLAEYPAAEVKDAKGAEIIERFLKEDPTIRPPKPEQIDSENKAKKSAEDNYDLVSETLAKIYIEQMLYHKAIDTYKKLSLKYPEKSRYFADLIQSIEKKF
ncbi:hypothetical protein [Pedobacter roseus]|uniref:Tetratricopeptide repeat protein n=1 Tax=Pedobacter roseus TaxID=336820 RepID=A0A7G9QEU3_9SPHI|nr:hypothetical protein [Pedobacter roseus]QNN41868.1 hypothetical protein H9L23_22665 [Pedobacter roseus]